MKKISILWAIFGFLFLLLSISYFIQAFTEIEKFKVIETNGGTQTMSISFGETDIHQPIKDFTEDFNEYISEVNNSNKRTGIINGIGYLLVSLVAFFSLYASNKKPNYSKQDDIKSQKDVGTSNEALNQDENKED